METNANIEMMYHCYMVVILCMYHQQVIIPYNVMSILHWSIEATLSIKNNKTLNFNVKEHLDNINYLS